MDNPCQKLNFDILCSFLSSVESKNGDLRFKSQQFRACGDVTLHLLTQGKKFFERSGERMLHIGFSSRIRQDDLPEEFTRKIECLSIGQSFFGTPLGRIFSEKIPFPHLERLRVKPGRSGVRFSGPKVSIFPSLRHLEMAGALNDEQRILTPFNNLVFPSLTTLKLTVRDTEVWLRVIEGCSNSLVSLSIKFTRFLHSEPFKVNLSNLQCLEITKYTDGITESLEFHYPGLGYLHGDQDAGKPLHLDINSVTRMRLDQVPLLSILPILCVLQLELALCNHSGLFNQLGSGSQTCPLLGSIEFRFLGEPHFDLAEEETLKELARIARLDIAARITTNKRAVTLLDVSQTRYVSLSKNEKIITVCNAVTQWPKSPWSQLRMQSEREHEPRFMGAMSPFVATMQNVNMIER